MQTEKKRVKKIQCHENKSGQLIRRTRRMHCRNKQTQPLPKRMKKAKSRRQPSFIARTTSWHVNTISNGRNSLNAIHLRLVVQANMQPKFAWYFSRLLARSVEELLSPSYQLGRSNQYACKLNRMLCVICLLSLPFFARCALRCEFSPFGSISIQFIANQLRSYDGIFMKTFQMKPQKMRCNSGTIVLWI